MAEAKKEAKQEAKQEARKYPAPQGNPETKPFWDAAAQGKFLIKRCTACGEPFEAVKPI